MENNDIVIELEKYIIDSNCVVIITSPQMQLEIFKKYWTIEKCLCTPNTNNNEIFLKFTY